MRRREAIIAGAFAGFGLVRPALARTTPARTTPVVLELFTSQGCSSCPPAESLLGSLLARPDVIALSWHVDYWNYLGWRDPFADRQWTERQRHYARALRAEVYTPALVVNGAHMVVGSDTTAVREAMAKVPALTVPASLTRDGDGLVATVGTEAVTALLAIYDPERITAVGAGENTGRRLKEYRVVREIRPLSPGTQRIGGIDPSRGAAVLVQDAAGRVVGAAEWKPVSS